MAIAILLGITALLGVGCVALGWSYAWRVSGATSGELGELVIELKRLPEAERLRALASRSRPGSWEHRLADEALAAPDDTARVIAINEALDDIEHIFRAAAGWPSAAIRIALFGAMLLGITAFLVSRDLRWALMIIGIGGVAAITCVEANRAARRDAEAKRRAIDDLVSTTLGHLAEGIPEEGDRRHRSAMDAPEGRSRRRGGRGGGVR